ncbi:MAG: trigger factor [Clostridiales bacterium]|nr:trigger factor [Clostridiales bacterium]
MALKSSNKINTNTYEIEVTVDSDTFKKACTQAYLKGKKNIQIPGFRKGKAPQGMIEKLYGEGAFYEEALDILYPQVVSDAFKEAELEVVDTPFDLEVPVISKENGVEMKMKVTTYPEVKLGEYKGLKAAKLPTEASDEDVENELKSMQERNSRLVVADDRASEMGDTVTLDFEGSVDGVAFDGGKGENFVLELGSGSFIPGFEEQVAGHKIDEEFDVNVTFPEDYAQELAGKDAVFKCVIHEIKSKELPELDDDFAQDVSEFDTLDELKEDLKKQIPERKESEAKTDIENQLLEQVCDNMEAEIPECMYTKRTDEMVQDYSYRLQAQGLNLDTYLQYIGQDMDSFKETFKESAQKQVKVSVALRAIIEAENIEATDQETDAQAAKLGEQYGMDAEKIKKAIPAENLIEDVKRNKAVDLVVESAVIE